MLRCTLKENCLREKRPFKRNLWYVSTRPVPLAAASLTCVSSYHSQSLGSTATATHAAIQHQILSHEIAVSSNTSILIFVTGKISIDGGNALQFSQVLNVVSLGPGKWALQNDMFRFVYGV